MNTVCQEINNELWQKDTYQAWVDKYGTPEQASVKILKDPDKILFPIRAEFGDVKGKRVVNLMGSMGQKAVALALLGAQTSVIDISPGNAIYAKELATCCGINIEYIVSDIMDLNSKYYDTPFDIAFAEMGILHYFIDLEPFFKVAYNLLCDSGVFIIRDFHPISTKLISSKGSTAKIRKHKVTGDYFDTMLEEEEVAFSKYYDEGITEKVMLRKWTLGEIVTALANTGFRIRMMREEPNFSSDVFDKGIPKTFTISCEKPFCAK